MTLKLGKSKKDKFRPSRPSKRIWLVVGTVSVVLLVSVFTVVLLYGGKQAEQSPQNTYESTYGWSYLGDFPASAVNITTLRLPDKRYVAYYVGGQPNLTSYKKPGRAFSTDGIHWQADSAWQCTDLCNGSSGQPVLSHRKHLALKDGRYRTYIKSDSDGGIISYISRDGLSWQKEAGVRLAINPAEARFKAFDAAQNFTPVYLADGRVRAYFEAVGTKPANLASSSCCKIILSAISSDNGQTFTIEDGVRINSADFGQTLATGSFANNDPTVVAMNGGYRIFFGTSIRDESAFSEDGLNFTWDGREQGILPLAGSDPSPYFLPDGRLAIMDGSQQAEGSKSCASTQYPNGCPKNYDLTHIVAWSKTGFSLKADKWNNQAEMSSATVDGPADHTVTLSVLDGYGGCTMTPGASEPSCNFDPASYGFTPASGQAPFTVAIARAKTQGRSSSGETVIVIAGKSGNETVLAKVNCIGATDKTANCN